jgi:hypothetical protein
MTARVRDVCKPTVDGRVLLVKEISGKSKFMSMPATGTLPACFSLPFCHAVTHQWPDPESLSSLQAWLFI